MFNRYPTELHFEIELKVTRYNYTELIIIKTTSKASDFPHHSCGDVLTQASFADCDFPFVYFACNRRIYKHLQRSQLSVA